jgi:hypothetical protein
MRQALGETSPFQWEALVAQDTESIEPHHAITSTMELNGEMNIRSWNTGC